MNGQSIFTLLVNNLEKRGEQINKLIVNVRIRENGDFHEENPIKLFLIVRKV